MYIKCLNNLKFNIHDDKYYTIYLTIGLID